MDRSEAFSLLKKHLKSENLIKHSLAVESCMKAMADHFGENRDKWGIAGLLHDLDYEYTSEESELHGIKTEEMLKGKDVSSEIIHAIKAHNHKVEAETKIDISLYAIDPTTGFITAVALMHPSKSLEAANLKRMKKRFKENSFAKGASREQMKTCEKLGMNLDEFLVICQKAMSDIHKDLGL